MRQQTFEELITDFRTRNFESLEQQFESYKQHIEEFFQQQQFEMLAKFIAFCSESVILSEYVDQALHYYYELVPRFEEHCPQQLDTLYLFIGHCYFGNLNFDEAKTYYYIATSHAMELKNFQVLSMTSNNLNAMQFDLVDPEILFEKSRMPSVLFKMADTTKSQVVLIRLIAHIELALQLGRLDYADQFHERYFGESPFEKDSRMDIQVRGVKGQILFGKGLYEEALQIFHECFMVCVTNRMNRDLILHLHEKIVLCYEKIGRNVLIPTLATTTEHVNKQMNRVLPSANKMQRRLQNAAIYSPGNFTHEIDQFEIEANRYCQNVAYGGHSLIVVDIELVSEYATMLEVVVKFIHEQMNKALGDKVLLSTRVDSTTLSYVVPLSEEACDTICRGVSQQVRDQFNQPERIYETIFFASVNNLEYGLSSYEQCRDYAHALIYYELYK